tara:strand:+ start:102 stop:392 length:291 start_codon:yes stop_codon:yes gene_type:complete
MSIDKETVKKIGNLAKIELSAKEIDIYSSQLTKIIDFMNKLDEVDTTKTKTFSNKNLDDHTGRPDDSVEDGNYVDKIIKNAPESKEGFFTIVKVIE